MNIMYLDFIGSKVRVLLKINFITTNVKNKYTIKILSNKKIANINFNCFFLIYYKH